MFKSSARFFLVLLLLGQTYLSFTNYGLQVAMLYIMVAGVAFGFGYFEGTDWEFLEKITERVDRSDISAERSKPWD